jgi:hypothetical protein
VHVNSGGEPERDDTGLPPVDIEVPDDARELDRDVQAYYRELRALRRRRRSAKLHGAMVRDSMVVPLLVCCLIFALIAGTLLTLFTATSINQNLPGTASRAGSSTGAARSSAGPSSAAAPSASSATPAPLVTSAPGQVTAATVAIAGHALPVRSLKPAVLLLVPANCSCEPAITHLAVLAQRAGARAFLVSTPATVGPGRSLARRLGHGLTPAEDTTRALSNGLHPVGLTAVLVAKDGSVTYAQRLEHSSRLAAVLQDANV